MTAWKGLPFGQLTYKQKGGNKTKSCLCVRDEQDQHTGMKHSFVIQNRIAHTPCIPVII